MKKERIEEFLISVSQKCGHCKHWRYTHYDMGECECYQIPNTHKDDGGICNGFKIDVYKVQIGVSEFTEAINQAELEWYKKLEKRLNQIMKNARQGGNSTMVGVTGYQFEIQNKIKELENGK